METPALLISPMMRPSWRVGQVSMLLYMMNVTSSPLVMVPCTASQAPKITTTAPCITVMKSPKLQ